MPKISFHCKKILTLLRLIPLLPLPLSTETTDETMRHLTRKRCWVSQNVVAICCISAFQLPPPDFLRGLLRLPLKSPSPFSFPPPPLNPLCLKSGNGPLGGRDGGCGGPGGCGGSAFLLKRATKSSVRDENRRASNVGII